LYKFYADTDDIYQKECRIMNAEYFFGLWYQ